MKTFLIALIASMSLNVAAFADESVPSMDELRSADELAQVLGLDDQVVTSDDEATFENDLGLETDNILPPPPGHGPRPGPRPPRPPRPRPPRPAPPHYPPYNPQPDYFQCGSQDLYGTNHWVRGYNPRQAQYDAHQICVRRSNGPCRDLGCRRY